MGGGVSMGIGGGIMSLIQSSDFLNGGYTGVNVWFLLAYM